MLDEYVRQTVKARFKCGCGNVWAARPNNILSGKGCPECGKISFSKKMRLSEETVRDRLAAKGATLISKYETTQSIALFQCNEGHQWETTPNSVMTRTGCPHCYEKNHPLTKEIVNARIADRGITMLGDYGGAHTGTVFQCSKGHTWDARPNNILNGKNCPHCDGQFPLSKEIVNERIADRGLVMLGEYTNSVTKTLFQCAEGHTWEAPPGQIVAGQGCLACSGHAPLTTEIVNERIAGRGLVLLDEYINNSTKRRFQCGEGHVWETVPAAVLSGRGCPSCAVPGFDPNEPAILYYVAVTTDDGDTRYKIGITNLEVEQRFPPVDLARIRVVKTWRFAVGRVAAEREADILFQFAGERYVGPDILVSKGNTELFTHDVLGLDTRCDEYGEATVDEDANLSSRQIQSDFDF
jgi:predicted  nucleic acid-binding Zn-ribbon protein